jgi:hypothetical protein
MLCSFNTRLKTKSGATLLTSTVVKESWHGKDAILNIYRTIYIDRPSSSLLIGELIEISAHSNDN